MADKPLAARGKQILQRQNHQRRQRRCAPVNADDNTNQTRTRRGDKLPADNEPCQEERTVRPHKDRQSNTRRARHPDLRRHHRRGHPVRIELQPRRHKDTKKIEDLGLKNEDLMTLF